jgi:hypothetical protein
MKIVQFTRTDGKRKKTDRQHYRLEWRKHMDSKARSRTQKAFLGKEVMLLTQRYMDYGEQ